MSAPIKVVVVDDSASMRVTLSRILDSDPAIQVVGAAPEPNAARAMIRSLSPDVLLLDVEMPCMDGLTFLERIMRLRPMPVVMCSTLTHRGTAIAIEALRLGAVDCVTKPSGDSEDLARCAETLRETVRGAAGSRLRPHKAVRPPQVLKGGRFRDVIVGIGASTGGVEALFKLLRSFPDDCPPVMVVQHMPAAFTFGFAARLDSECGVRVVEARDGEPLERGTVYIAPGGRWHMGLAPGEPPRVALFDGDKVDGHRPSVSRLFHSLAHRRSRALGVILTGMGEDGADGLLAMRRAGAVTFGESAASCVVYGMPRAANDLGAVQRQLPLSAMADAVLKACRE